MTIQRKRGEDIEAGDIIVVGQRSHLVEAVDPYIHPTLGRLAGIARCADGFAITLTGTVCLDVQTTERRQR